MNRLLRHGQLEVETDLLLGVEEVLLPGGWEASLASPSGFSTLQPKILEPKMVGAETVHPSASEARMPATAPAARTGFEPELFAARPASRVAANPAVAETVVTAARSPTTERPAAVEAPSAPMPSTAAMELLDSVPIPDGATKADRLAALEARHAKACPHCTTATAHTRLVFGEGNPDASLVFVGEAPGETEDQLGRPFVGKAGEKLDEMIRAMGFRREDVYIANVLKSRPPDNRTPLAHEIAACGPYLLAQLAVVSPGAIVTLGGPASKLLLRSELGITRLRGVFGSVWIREIGGGNREIPVMPTFHPAYLLRNYTPETRAQMWSDLKQVLERLGRPLPARR